VTEQTAEELQCHDISDLDNDTVAVAIVEGTLYVACNYKVRRMFKNKEGKFEKDKSKTWKKEYRGFGEISVIARQNVLGMLRRELSDLGPRMKLNRVVFLGIEGELTNQNQSAAPHAEMQICSWFDLNGLKPAAPIYFGVSKPCCAYCGERLRGKGWPFRQVGAGKVSNWAPPEEIKCKIHFQEPL